MKESDEDEKKERNQIEKTEIHTGKMDKNRE
jgi:hypothetical protein